MRPIATLTVLLLAGCAGAQDGWTCYHAAGPEPGAAWYALGGFATLAIAQRADHQAWEARRVQCVRERMALRSDAP